MTIRLELNPEMEARLVAEARSQGVPLEKLAERLLKEALTVSSLPHGVLTVDEFHHMLEGMAEGSEKLPNLPTESFSRESFYEDRLDGGMPYLLDSNILLRSVKPDHNDYPLVVSAIEAILRRDGELCYTSQNVGEFWNTCTRPLDRNGYALSPQEIDRRDEIL